MSEPTPIRSTAASGECPLSELQPGDRARVVEVTLGGPSGRRLRELGLLPETEVEVIRVAPLGDPVEFELLGYRLCLRRSEAAHVRVRRDS